MEGAEKYEVILGELPWTRVQAVDNLWKVQLESWYVKSEPIYCKLDKPPIPGITGTLEKREKEGRTYWLFRPQNVFDNVQYALIHFDSGDLWRSWYDLKLVDGQWFLIISACGGSRGGAHYHEQYIYAVKIGSIVKEANGGFKSRYPSESVYQIVLEKRTVMARYRYSYECRISDKEPEKPEEWDIIKTWYIPTKKEMGTLEDYLVTKEL